MESSSWKKTSYCSKCNDPPGSCEACDGKSLAKYARDTVCAIKGAKPLGYLGKTATLTFPDGHKESYVVRDHCGTDNAVDIWMGKSSKCKCDYNEPIVSIVIK